MPAPEYKTYKDIALPVAGQKVTFHQKQGRVIDGVFLRRLTAGTVLNVHVPPSADPIPIDETEGVDLSDFDFDGDVALSVDTNPGSALATVVVVFRS